MGELQCLCGKALSNVSCPSPNNAWLLRDFDIKDAKNWDACNIIENGRDVWECHKCGRIAIGNCFNASVKWYRPEDGVPGNIAKC